MESNLVVKQYIPYDAVFTAATAGTLIEMSDLPALRAVYSYTLREIVSEYGVMGESKLHLLLYNIMDLAGREVWRNRHIL